MFTTNERIRLMFLATKALDGAPLAGQGVLDARATLEKATSALTAAQVRELAAKEAVSASSARVRDATDQCFEECRRARGALIAKDSVAGERLPVEVRHRTPAATFARANLLLAAGTDAGVALPVLVQRRDELATALGARLTARAERAATRKDRPKVHGDFDLAYAGLRSAVEQALGAKGFRGVELRAAVKVYFPPHSAAPARRPEGAPTETTPKPASPRAEGKPAA